MHNGPQQPRPDWARFSQFLRQEKLATRAAGDEMPPWPQATDTAARVALGRCLSCAARLHVCETPGCNCPKCYVPASVAT